MKSEWIECSLAYIRFPVLLLLSTLLMACGGQQDGGVKDTIQQDVAQVTPAEQESEMAGLDPNEVDAAVSQYAAVYDQNCAVCHGENLQGAAQGTPLLGVLKHGDSQADIERAIRDGFVQSGMPAWGASLNEEQVRNLALYVAETRAGLDYKDYQYGRAIEVPTEPIQGEEHSFRLETVATGLDALPYSIAPLPDGRFLLTEKKLGLRIVSSDGKRSGLLTGAPVGYADSTVVSFDQEWGHGWVLDVALHPDYANNQWVYLAYTERCTECNAVSKSADDPVTMLKIVRGQIRGNAWLNEETVFEADKALYGPMPDIIVGGRLAFDGAGHLYFSVGMKGIDNYTGLQDLSTPWGKIHRIRDNGEIPPDNPFYNTEGAYKTVWTYGHRSPQGLEWRRQTGEVWGTEMGPRGGDEVNRLLPGKNYGWPLTSLGMNYDGKAVAYGDLLGIEFDLADIEQPVVDLTPAPAVSSFVFYAGKAFPKWNNHLLVSSLKGQRLIRIALDGNTLAHQEILIPKLARIRDIEVGNAGEVYLLLENNNGGQIVRMVPAE